MFGLNTEAEDPHDTHCSFCHATACRFSKCPMTVCVHCRVDLHECKVNDHLEICLKVVVACLNEFAGCPSRIRRDRLSAHLLGCPANSIVCGRDRSRACLNDESKIRLKGYGKHKREDEVRYMDDEPMDVQLANEDQRMIIASYGYSRKSRVRRRDKFNKREPLLPLRDIYDKEGNVELPSPSQPQENSSDEEKRIEREKLEKSRKVFAQCFMCQLDPATQHLHTLGRDDVKYDELVKKLKRRKAAATAKTTPFFLERSLMISIIPEFVPEVTLKSENIQLIHNGGTLYTRKCLHSMRRCDIGSHVLSQHADGDCRLDCHVTRCPMWSYGCTFTDRRLIPEAGEIRYIASMKCFAFRPTLSYESPPPENDGLTLDKLPVCVIVEVAEYLSGLNLQALSATCMAMRETLYTFCRHRAIVSINWEKKDGSWNGASRSWSFPLSDFAPRWLYQPATSLSVHLSSCPFREVSAVYSARRSAVLPDALFLAFFREQRCERIERRSRSRRSGSSAEREMSNGAEPAMKSERIYEETAQ